MSFQLSRYQGAFKTRHFLLSVQLQSPLIGTACVSTNLGFTQQHAGTEKWASYSSDLHSHTQQRTILVHSAHSFITSPPASLNYPRWSWADSRFAIKIKERRSRPLTQHSSSVTVPLPLLHLPKPCNAQPLLLLPGEAAKHIQTLPSPSSTCLFLPSPPAANEQQA